MSETVVGKVVFGPPVQPIAMTNGFGGHVRLYKGEDYDALLADRDRLAAELAAARALLREARGGCVGTDSPWLGSDQQEAWCHRVDALIGAASSAGAQYATGTDCRCPKCKGIGPCSECNPDPRAGLTVGTSR